MRPRSIAAGSSVSMRAREPDAVVHRRIVIDGGLGLLVARCCKRDVGLAIEGLRIGRVLGRLGDAEPRH